MPKDVNKPERWRTFALAIDPRSPFCGKCLMIEVENHKQVAKTKMMVVENS